MSTFTDIRDFLMRMAEPAALADAASAAIIVASATWGCLSYFHKKETSLKDEKIAQLEENLQVAKRMLETPIRVVEADFDLGAIGPRPLWKVPAGYKHDGRLNIVTLDEAQWKEIWTVTETTPEAIYSEWFGNSLHTHQKLRQAYEAMSGAVQRKCILWKGTKTYRVSGNEVIQQMYPFAFVIVTPLEPGTDPTTNELTNFLVWLRGFAEAIPTMKLEIQTMHRTENIAYIRARLVFDDFVIEGLPRPKYYLMRQIAVVKGLDKVYVISTGLPDENLHDEYFDYLQKWWAAFNVVQ